MILKSKIFILKSKIGFTLVEVLVVVALIGILAGVLLVSLSGARASARDAQRKADLETIQSALALYKSTCGKYPASLTPGSSLVGCDGAATPMVFLSKVPDDPIESNSYVYTPDLSGTRRTYTLDANLESGLIMQVTPNSTNFVTPTPTPLPTNTPTPLPPTPTLTPTPTPCLLEPIGGKCDNNTQCCSNYCDGKKCIVNPNP